MATNNDHIETATDVLIDAALAGINRALDGATTGDAARRNLTNAQAQLRAAVALRNEARR